jgi:hypothetical protein
VRGLLHELVLDAKPCSPRRPFDDLRDGLSGMGPSENSSNRAVSDVAD